MILTDAAPAEMTAVTAAHDMHMGSKALIWAAEQGIITGTEFDEAELAFDTAQNRVYAAAELI